eukprot:TRINITY_DN7753_c0_g1_i1.p1 TRINITY_DN7753_c0_g1~~TRINITY_DN7753_c0_g1_i1.p1  ORF type:complete len:208 (-),score=61.10 TRINITY_DN7753_c0_g1_i1:305-928(-)
MAQREIKLYSNSRERRQFEDLADLFSIIKTVEALETAYVRSYVGDKEYTDACTKLIGQYKTVEAALQKDGHVKSLDAFMAEYNMDCPRAKERLQIALPATIVHRSTDSHSETVHVAETVQFFITLLDSLKLGELAVDIVQPQLTDLLGSLNKVSQLPTDFIGKEKVESWLKTLNSMRASEELSDDQARQLSFEVEQSYTQFHQVLKK